MLLSFTLENIPDRGIKVLGFFSILVMLAILSILIIVHEFGHYTVARFFGFQTPVFGFGLPFGPYWVLGHKWGTQFRIHACVLGGYVAIPELGDETNAREENYGVPLQPFKKFPIWQRALVAFAGVGFNILFAWLVMFIMLTSIGEPISKVVVGALPKENPIAARAGVKVDDVLLGIDSRKMTTSEEVIGYLSSHASKEVTLNVQREGKPVDIKVTPNESGKVGMALTLDTDGYKKPEGNFFELASLTTDRLVKLTGNMLQAIGSLFAGIFHVGKPAAGAAAVGVGDLHGVLAVVKIGADIAQQDWSQLFMFTVLISLDLAIINLVPWPALDGGHLAFMALEAVRGKPMGERAHGEIVKWGFVSLLVLMAVIMVNDVQALLTGKLDMKKNQREHKEAPKTGTPAPAESGSTAAPAEAPAQQQPLANPAR